MAQAQTLIEGTTRLTVPTHAAGRGPKARASGFYNPAMRTARDVSIALLRHWTQRLGRPLRVLDGLAGAGARGLRMAHEVPGTRVTLNDMDPKAADAIESNAAALGLETVHVRRGPFQGAAAENRYDWVDVDPYGTAAPFLDAGVQAVRHKGILAVAATDTATLCGLYPDTCRRRYDARSRKSPFQKEAGLRILAGAIVRAAARHDRAATPVLCHATDHYMRVYATIQDGAQRADTALSKVGYSWWNDEGRGLDRVRRPETQWSGPLWTQGLHENEALSFARQSNDGITQESQRLLERLHEEVDAPGLFYTMAELGYAGIDPLPRIAKLISDLRDAGHRAARSHLEPAAVRTDASWAELLRIAAP